MDKFHVHECIRCGTIWEHQVDLYFCGEPEESICNVCMQIDAHKEDN